jgi:hypothetical protein
MRSHPHAGMFRGDDMIADHVLDQALATILRDASRLDICSDKPMDHANVAKLSLGHKTVPKLGGPEACEGGRMLVVAPIDDGMVTKKGEPKYWCLTGQGRLLCCEPLNTQAKVALIPGIAFTLPPIRIRMVSPN